MVDVAMELIYQGDTQPDSILAREDYMKALEVADLIEKNLPESSSPFGLSITSSMAEIFTDLGADRRLDDPALTEKGRDLLWGLLERYAPYIAYNREMAMSFGSPALTIETRLIPYQYYHFVNLYQEAGGDLKKVETLLKPYGFTIDDLKTNYERLYGRKASSSDDTSTAQVAANSEVLEGYAKELDTYFALVNNLAKLSAEEYAARPADELLTDSMLNQALEYFFSVGGTEEMLNRYDSYKNLDRQRTKRVNQEYVRRHPEAAM